MYRKPIIQEVPEQALAEMVQAGCPAHYAVFHPIGMLAASVIRAAAEPDDRDHRV